MLKSSLFMSILSIARNDMLGWKWYLLIHFSTGSRISGCYTGSETWFIVYGFSFISKFELQFQRKCLEEKGSSIFQKSLSFTKEGFKLLKTFFFMKTSAIPVDTGHKLNVHKTFRRCPGRVLNVLCMFNSRPVSTAIFFCFLCF